MSPKAESALLYRDNRKELVDYATGIVRDRTRAEDVVQDAWERFQAAEQGRTLAEPLRYLYRIVRNLALDRYRASKREISRLGGELADVAEMLADEAPSAEAGLAAREELRIVMECLDELPDRNRLALTLHTIEGLKLREVADRLGVSISFTHKLIAEAKLHCLKRLARRP